MTSNWAVAQLASAAADWGGRGGGLLRQPVPDPAPTPPGWPPGKGPTFWSKPPSMQWLADNVYSELLTKPEFAAKGPEALNFGWILGILDVVKILKRSNRLKALTDAPYTAFPRVKVCVDAVEDPENFVIPPELQADVKGQFAELTAWRLLPTWPTALTTGVASTNKEVREAMWRLVMRERDLLPSRMAPAAEPGKAQDARLGLVPMTRAMGAKEEGGYKYTAPPSAGPATSNRLEGIARREIAHEGSAASINTYDSAHLSFGRGFTGVTLVQIMDRWQTASPEVRDRLFRAGFGVEGGNWVYMSTKAEVLRGAAAVSEIRADTRLLTLLMDLGEQGATGQELDRVQLDWITAERVRKAPSYAAGRPEVVVAVNMHIAHWLPAHSWEAHSADYEGATEPLAIARTLGRFAGTRLANGAMVMGLGLLTQNPLGIGHFGTFGAGVGQGGWVASAVRGAPLRELTRAEAEKDEALAGHVLYVAGDAPAEGARIRLRDLGP